MNNFCKLRIHLYPVSVAAFKAYKNAKFLHRTDAELSGSSWVFEPLVDAHAELDQSLSDDDDVSIFTSHSNRIKRHN